MRTISDLRTWKSKETGEFRVYVTFDDKSEGCYFMTGSKYQEKGTLTNMTIEEKKQALEVSSKKHGSNKWGDVRYWEINPSTSKVSNTYTSNKKSDEEDLDQLSRKQRIEYKDKSDMSYEG